MKKLVIIISIIVVGQIASWYFDIWHSSIETIDELIGHNYDYAHKIYFQRDPDKYYKININSNLNEFDGGIINKKDVLTDSIIHVFTWHHITHKKTIWVGRTNEMNFQIIDAIRYKNNVQF